MSAFTDLHRHWLMEAIKLSKKCPKTDRSFAVGAVIADRAGELLMTGFSLELGAGWHAEEVALRKAADQGIDVSGCTLYSSLEPCSLRLSGKCPCVQLIIQSGITTVVFALHEPPLFVTCEGRAALVRRGIEVIHLPEYGSAVEAANRHIIQGK